MHSCIFLSYLMGIFFTKTKDKKEQGETEKMCKKNLRPPLLLLFFIAVLMQANWVMKVFSIFDRSYST